MTLGNTVGDIISRNSRNNFNLIRLFMAFGVLYNHAFVLFDPQGKGDVFGKIFHHFDSGSFSVCVFFLISGMLLSQSFFQTKVKLKWILRRIMRIFPGLVVNLMVTVFIIGALGTSLPLRKYFLSRDTYRFFYNAMLNNEVFIFNIPGCFLTNKAPEIMNGSLWTLPFELTCFMLLFLILSKLEFFKSANYTAVGKLIIAAITVFCLAYMLNGRYLIGRVWGLLTGFNPETVHGRNNPLFLFLFFLTGAVLYQLRSRIPISWKIGVPVLLAAVTARFSGSPVIEWISEYLVLVYGTLMLAAAPALFKWNSVVDPSYGIYLYGWPVQQLISHYFPLGALPSVMVSIPVVMAVGVLSFLFVEKPCMESVDAIMQRIKGVPAPATAMKTN